MRKIVATIFCVISIYTVTYSQTDFFEFIENINWNCTESGIVQKYSNIIKESKHYNNSEYETNWEIDNVTIGNYNLLASFFVDTITKQLVSISFKLSEIALRKENAKELSKKLDSLISTKYGIPDYKEDDEGKFSTQYDRTWYKDDVIIEVCHFVFQEGQLYVLWVKAIDSQELDFRVAKWGDSKEQIIAKEGRVNFASSDSSMYAFEDKISELNCDVAYFFTQNKLSMALYSFNIEHTNQTDYILDFEKIVSLLTVKYGKPDYNEIKWKNSLYKNDKENYGFAVSLGHLIFETGWFNDKTRIFVSLCGENYKLKLFVKYESNKYKSLKETEEKKVIIEKF